MAAKADFKQEFTTGQLWEYALALYAEAGVADTCLALQDDFGHDVNLLLTACFCGARDWRWSASLVASLRSQGLPVQRQYAQPLRALRRQAKATAPEGFYAALKAAELEAEHWQLSVLAETLRRHPEGNSLSLAQGLALGSATAHNLQLCCHSADDREWQWLQQLVLASTLLGPGQ